MHVISVKPFQEAAKKYPNQREAIMGLYRVLRKARFKSPDEMRKVFPSLDFSRMRNTISFVKGIKKVKTSYLAFAKSASPLLYIKGEEHYEVALQVVEALLSEAKDDDKDPLNGLIDVITRAIETYEHSKPEFKAFHKKLRQQKQDIAVLRLLMDQHELGVADFPEIGDKSLISKILSGERNLTKKHIKKLSERFSIDPGLFF